MYGVCDILHVFGLSVAAARLALGMGWRESDFGNRTSSGTKWLRPSLQGPVGEAVRNTTVWKGVRNVWVHM